MAEEKLDMIKDDYELKKNRKWKLLIFGSVLGLILGYLVPLVSTKLNNSLYKRDNVDTIMKEYLGYDNFGSLLTNETVIVAYEYNSQEPRFYSKYFTFRNPLIYDMPVGNATGASSAAPAYFDPKVN
jgi:patatin-like phospholipase/acyl hydrolase